MTTFTLADKSVMQLISKCMHEWHSKLAEADVHVGVLFAFNEDGPAVTHGGYPAFGKIKIVPLKDRLTKRYEAELLVDQTDWSDTEEPSRLAFIDHELCHLELVELDPVKREIAKKKNKPWWKVDSLDLPKLKLRKGDWNGGDGFVAVCQRHGENAIEFQNMKNCFEMAKEAKRIGWNPEEQSANADAAK